MTTASAQDPQDLPEARVGSPAFPSPEAHLSASARASIDSALATLEANKEAWAALPIRQRIAILKQVQKAYAALGERWVEANVRAKDLPRRAFAEGEEWIIFVMGMRALNHLRASLEAIERGRRPSVSGGLRIDAEGKTLARVFPAHWTDYLLYRGITADVWMADGVTPDDVLAEQAWAYQQATDGRLSLVLGAGNLSILPMLDALDRLFVKKQVVLLKTNPVLDYMDPLFAEALGPLIREGFVQMVSGGPEAGEYLTRHPAVQHIHMTGSDKTFQKIVFGRNDLPNRDQSSPAANVGLSAELGNVTPLIVVPGPWTRRDLKHKAVQLASWMAINASFNCLSPRIIVQHAEWPLRDAFLDELETALARTPTRLAYYPGAHERHQRFVRGHQDVRQIGMGDIHRLPWTVIRNVDPDHQEDMSFRSEVFCSVLSETGLHAGSVPEFIQQAVDFANSYLWGTLIVSLFVHPRSLADPRVRSAVDRAIADLRYGTVCLNLRAEYGYYPLLSPWGGAPGSPLDDVQSGLGVINNPLMFKSSVKSVVRGPFRQWPDPFLVTARHTLDFGKALSEFERRHALNKLPRVLWAALRG